MALWSRLGLLQELWPSLLEKAYARLHGGYAAIAQGSVGDALVDLTGGIVSKISLADETHMADAATGKWRASPWEGSTDMETAQMPDPQGALLHTVRQYQSAHLQRCVLAAATWWCGLWVNRTRLGSTLMPRIYNGLR